MAVFVSHEREKLINAILFFAHNTRHLGKIKLFKLLYLLDFEHFSQAGKSVTGLEYSAWKFGPVPPKVMEEWEEPEADIASAITIQPERVIDYERQTVVPNTPFDDTHFTKRELRLMEALAERFRDTASPKMIDVTHAENGAWAKVWQGGEGHFQEIPYTLGLSDDAPNRDAILAKAREYQATRDSHSTRPAH